MSVARLRFRDVDADDYASHGFVIERVEGLIDTPDLVVTDLSIADMDGVVAGPGVYGGRTIRLGLAIISEGFDAAALYDAALRSLTRGHDVLTVNWPYLAGGRSLIADVECRKRVVALDPLYDAAHARISVELLAAWPYWQDDALRSSSTAIAIPTGFTFNLTFSFNFGGNYNPGSAVCVNEGTAPAWPVVTIRPTTSCPSGLSLIERWKDQTAEFRIIGGLAAGDVVVVDMREHEITLGGFPNQSLRDPVSDWLVLPPGTSTIQLVIPSGVATATIEWRSAWL